jgi:hypothetical protein
LNRRRIVLFIMLILLYTLLVGCQGKDEVKYDSLMEVGEQALKEGEYDEAILTFKNALKEKPNDEAALELLMEAQKMKTEAELSEINEEETSGNQDLTIDIKRDDNKFYINDLTLLMSKDEIITKWGEPDQINKPDPNDDYYKEDYDEWLFLTYGDMSLTIYSDLLRVIDLRPEESMLDDDWYKALGEPDQVVDNYFTFTSEEHFLSFSGDEPHMQWAEAEPKPSSQTAGETNTKTVVDEGHHLSSMKPIEFFKRFNQLTENNITLNDFEPLYDWEDNTKLLGYTYSLTDNIDLSYNGKEFVEAVDIVQYGGSKPSPQFLNLFENLIVAASTVEPADIIKRLDGNLVKSDNGQYISSVVYHDGLVYRYLENNIGYYFYVYVEGYEEL